MNQISITSEVLKAITKMIRIITSAILMVTKTVAISIMIDKANMEIEAMTTIASEVEDSNKISETDRIEVIKITKIVMEVTAVVIGATISGTGRIITITKETGRHANKNMESKSKRSSTKSK